MEFQLTITGTAPLLMHSSRLSNPLDPATKALKKVTAKRTKTDDDHAEAARLEWTGGLYWDTDLGPYVPGDNVWRSLYDAAKKSRRGPSVKEGVIITSDVNPLAYGGPRDMDALWADENYRLMASVKVTTSRVMRCRPMFRTWSTRVHGVIDPNVIDLSDLRDIADTAGQLVGLGDWRPRYGRYTTEVTA